MKKHYGLKYMSKKRLVCKSVAFNVLREIQMLQEISHTFIVNLWYTFQDQTYVYMISDLLLGGDLRFHLNQGRFSEARVKFYVCEIALALDYLHIRRIVHRDLK
jgi:serine/threonine kinase 32